jgi:hypothetical protein
MQVWRQRCYTPQSGRMCCLRCRALQRKYRSYKLFAVYRGSIGSVGRTRNLFIRLHRLRKGVHQRGAMVSWWVSCRGTLLWTRRVVGRRERKGRYTKSRGERCSRTGWMCRAVHVYRDIGAVNRTHNPQQRGRFTAAKVSWRGAMVLYGCRVAGTLLRPLARWTSTGAGDSKTLCDCRAMAISTQYS